MTPETGGDDAPKTFSTASLGNKKGDEAVISMPRYQRQN